jgi:SAM-dependent methyltransferase
MTRNLRKYQLVYSNQPFEKHQVEYRRKFILSILNQFKPKSILEVGCGEKTICLDYLDFDSFTIIEPTDAFYRQALFDTIEIPNINLVNELLEDWEKEINCNDFDFIIVSCLIHEITNLDLFMKRIVKLCTNKTIVHFSAPNMHSFHRLLALEMGIINSIFEKSDNNKALQQNLNFDLDMLIQLVKEYNFDILDEGSYFIKPFSHIQMQKILDLNIATDVLLDGLYNLAQYFPKNGSEIFVNCKINNL